MLQSAFIIAEILSAVGPKHQTSPIEEVVLEAAEVRLRLELPSELSGASELPVAEAPFVRAFTMNNQSPLAFWEAVGELALVPVVFRFEGSLSAGQSVAPLAIVEFSQRKPENSFAVGDPRLELSLVHRDQPPVGAVDSGDEIFVSREGDVLDPRVQVSHSLPPGRVLLLSDVFAEGVVSVLPLSLESVARRLVPDRLERPVRGFEEGLVNFERSQFEEVFSVGFFLRRLAVWLGGV